MDERDIALVAAAFDRLMAYATRNGDDAMNWVIAGAKRDILAILSGEWHGDDNAVRTVTTMTPYAMTYAGDRATRAAYMAGLMSEAEWQAHRAAVRECPNSWYNWYVATMNLAANANDNQPPADVRALIAWQQGDGQQDDLFGNDDAPAKQAVAQAALASAQGQMN